MLRGMDFDSLLAQLGEGMLTQMEATARERVADTRAKLTALSG